jgi:biopolymer transport protein ExbD
MSMSTGSGDSDESMMDINMTPLIDVLLVLLIYLIINLPPATHAVKMDLPVQRPPKDNQIKTEPVVINLEVDYDGSYYWDGTLTDFATLESYLRQAGVQEPKPELHINPNPRTKYDFVAKALAAAQRSQVERIGFVGNEQYME